MRRVGILLFLAVFVPVRPFPNGSPINTGEILRTGNIEMIQKKDIQLQDEDLSVRLEGDWAHVRVTYVLKNLGPGDKVTYGFPIEIDRTQIEEFKPKEESIAAFRIVEKPADGVERPIPFAKIVTEKEDGESSHGPVTEWHVAELSFLESEEKTVVISYRVKCQLEDIVYTKSFRPVFSARTFTYGFKPSKNWGNGRVPRCLVRVDVRSLLAQKAVIADIRPGGYTTKDGVITWDYRDLELENTPDVEVVYDNSATAFSSFVRGGRLSPEAVTKCRASSVLKADNINRFGYEPINLFDGDLNTAWAEGAPDGGEGEWVEMDLAEGLGLEAVGIINGYTKNEALYIANSRIRKLRLDIEYASGAHYKRPGEAESVEIVLDEKHFNELNRDAEAPFIDWLKDFGMGEPVRKIRLTILEVTYGGKYDDTCISELYLLGYKSPMP